MTMGSVWNGPLDSSLGSLAPLQEVSESQPNTTIQYTSSGSWEQGNVTVQTPSGGDLISWAERPTHLTA